MITAAATSKRSSLLYVNCPQVALGHGVIAAMYVGFLTGCGGDLIGNLHVGEAPACRLVLGAHEQIYEAARLHAPPHLREHTHCTFPTPHTHIRTRPS